MIHFYAATDTVIISIVSNEEYTVHESDIMNWML